jgi:hypothetical protein
MSKLKVCDSWQGRAIVLDEGIESRERAIGTASTLQVTCDECQNLLFVLFGNPEPLLLESQPRAKSTAGLRERVALV